MPLTKRYVSGTSRNSTSCLQSTKLARGSTEKAAETSVRPRTRRAARRTTAPRPARGARRAAPIQHTTAIARQNLRDRDRELQRARDAESASRPERARTFVSADGAAARRARWRLVHASMLSAASTTCSGVNPRQATEVARRADPLVARPARQGSGVDRRASAAAALRHGADRSGSVGPYSPTIGHVRRRGDVQRPAVAADEKRGTVDERAQAPRARTRRSRARRRGVRSERRPGARRGPRRAAAALRRPRAEDDAPHRGSARQRSSSARRNESSGQRRNGIAGADVDDDTRSPSATPASASRARHASGRSPDRRPSRPASRSRSGGVDVRAAQQIPLVLDRMPRRAAPAAGATRRVYIQLRPAIVVADPLAARRSARSAATRAARRENRSPDRIAARAAAGPARCPPSAPARPRPRGRDDHVVDMRVVLDDRRRVRLDDVGDVGGGKVAAQRANGRRREDDIADLAEPDQKNAVQLTFRSWPRRSA